ncbi:MAG TPA: histidine phosphatase family protein [Myxococcaceae bacterium]|nr:histidine phosphatase family protein [Myxococcaceae bacterium]
MKVYLVRHAQADSDVPEGLDDAARPLTGKGRHAAEKHFKGLAKRMHGVGLVLMSPLVRAVQTAQILALVQDLDVPVRVHRSLLPDMPVGSQERLLDAHRAEDLVLVGHNPSIPAMAAHLMKLAQFPRSVPTGTVIALDLEKHREPARLVFFAAPGEDVLDELKP